MLELPEVETIKRGLEKTIVGKKIAEVEPCRECGEEILSVKLGGRTGSYCPHCQK